MEAFLPLVHNLLILQIVSLSRCITKIVVDKYGPPGLTGTFTLCSVVISVFSPNSDPFKLKCPKSIKGSCFKLLKAFKRNH